MYLSSVQIRNFRCFDNNEHIINFNPGLTVLVGENDSGKSAVMDAIRIVLGTTDLGWHRIDENDFYNEDTSLEISIICKFSNLTSDEQGAFLECLTYEEVNDNIEPYLYLNWKCKYLLSFNPPRTVTYLTSGKDGNGPMPSSESRELLRVTYLRALRDSYSDMQSGRHSRLSQIIQHIDDLTKGIDEYTHGIELQDLSLVGIANLSNSLLANHASLKSINDSMTNIMNNDLLLKHDDIKTRFEVAGALSKNEKKVQALLEKLDLGIDKGASAMMGKVGLGTSNIMSMACEMLLHKDPGMTQKSSFLLIEEPEAHIHAQRQLKVIQSLENEAETKNQQIIITTHSPILASVVKLQNIIMMRNNNAFPFASEYTKLKPDDYKYLEKYLDATKANLFFARGVIIVEGPGEALLLPTIAEIINKSFTDYGISLVDVRSTGLRRFARIFQRTNDSMQLNINVACITDRDIMPNCGPKICIDDTYTYESSTWPPKEKRKWRSEEDFTLEEKNNYLDKIKEKADGQTVRTFVSEHWTLEYDLAYKGLEDDEMKKVLINSLVKSGYQKKNWNDKIADISQEIDNCSSIEEKASWFYRYFYKKTVSKADFAQQLAIELEETYTGRGLELQRILPDYLINAIEYVIEVENEYRKTK